MCRRGGSVRVKQRLRGTILTSLKISSQLAYLLFLVLDTRSPAIKSARRGGAVAGFHISSRSDKIPLLHAATTTLSLVLEALSGTLSSLNHLSTATPRPALHWRHPGSNLYIVAVSFWPASPPDHQLVTATEGSNQDGGGKITTALVT